MWYDDKWKPVTRGDRHLPRPAGAPPPCRACPKVPPGVEPRPENAVEATDQARRCYEHYRECRAVGSFPDDPLVRHHARVFRDVEDAAERRADLDTQLVAIGSLLTRL